MADQQKSSASQSDDSKTLRFSYCQILGVEPDATPHQIRQAYRQKSKLYHPDTTVLDKKDAAEKFQLVTQAYQALNAQKTTESQPYQDRRQPKDGLNESTVRVRSHSDSQNHSAFLDAQDRPLSPGEVFALFILGITFLACLVLALIVGIARGEVLLTDLPASFSPLREKLLMLGPDQPTHLSSFDLATSKQPQAQIAPKSSSILEPSHRGQPTQPLKSPIIDSKHESRSIRKRSPGQLSPFPAMPSSSISFHD